MPWQGPTVDGISQSLYNKFDSDPYTFYIYAYLGLEEDQPPAENLTYGDVYHKGLEILLRTHELKYAMQEALDYMIDKYPQAPRSFQYSIPKLLSMYPMTNIKLGTWTTEDIFEMNIQHHNVTTKIRGKRDGTCTNHTTWPVALAEHKCKGYIDREQTRRDLVTDFQVNMYLPTILNPNRLTFTDTWVIYDLIKIPDVQKYGPKPNAKETPNQWIHRLFHGPIGSYNGQYPIFGRRNQWIQPITRCFLQEDIEEFWDKTILPQFKKVHLYHDWVTQSNFDPDNPKFYNELFYKRSPRMFDARKTEKFECAYYSLLIGETTLDDLVPVKSYFNELEEL